MKILMSLVVVASLVSASSFAKTVKKKVTVVVKPNGTIVKTVVVVKSGIDLSHPRNQGGMLLGQTRVNENRDRDVLKLPACKGSWNKPVSHLKLFVRQYPVQIDRLKVKFQNGQNQVLNVKDHFKAGTSSRWINLKGNKRCIKNIVIVGDTDTPRYAPNKRSLIKVYGLK